VDAPGRDAGEDEAVRQIDVTDARAIASAVARHFEQKRLCAVSCEFGLANNQRLDVIGVNYWGEILGAEVKVTRQDWRGDQKWYGYTQYCDWLWFAFPAGLVTPAEFRATAAAKHAGMIEVNERAGISVVVNAKRNRLHFPRRFDVMYRLAMRAGDSGFCPNCGWRPTRLSVADMTEEQIREAEA
jgi:hypothetical protein